MSNIIDLAYLRDVAKINPLIIPTEYGQYDDNSVGSISVFNTLLFILSDLKELKKSVIAKGFNFNEGPQSWRGQINSINSLLNTIDMDYRYNLYLHNF